MGSDRGSEEYGDTQRVIARYSEATRLLEHAVKRREGSCFPELKGEPGSFDVSFRHKINMILNAGKEKAAKRGPRWKSRHVLQCIFTALSPFAKNFLLIAKDVQTVGISFLIG